MRLLRLILAVPNVIFTIILAATRDKGQFLLPIIVPNFQDTTVVQIVFRFLRGG